MGIPVVLWSRVRARTSWVSCVCTARSELYKTSTFPLRKTDEKNVVPAMSINQTSRTTLRETSAHHCIDHCLVEGLASAPEALLCLQGAGGGSLVPLRHCAVRELMGSRQPCLQHCFVFLSNTSSDAFIFIFGLVCIHPAASCANTAQIRSDHNKSCPVVSLLSAVCLSVWSCLQKSEQGLRCLENPQAVIGSSPNK